MSIENYKRLLTILVLVVMGLLGAVGNLAWKYHQECMDARLTWNTVMDYERSRRVGGMNAEETANILYYVSHVGLRVRNRYLSRLADREQFRAIQDIIAELRRKTGQDLGDDPEPWIEKFCDRGRRGT